MRTRLLISVALAVALGFTAGASAGENTAVITVITDPGGIAGTWEVRARLWSSAGVGIETDDLGFLDFVLMEVVGTGDYEVTDSLNAAPGGQWDTEGSDGVIDVGFFGDRSDPNNYGIRYDGTAGVGILGLQPVSYAGVGENNATRDQAVLLGIGVRDGTWDRPTGDSLAWDADTLIATGTYDAHGGSGTIDIKASGEIDGNWYEPRDCFSVLPDPDHNDLYEGPTVDFGYGVKPVYEPALVTRVVTQTTTVAGNDGGNVVADRPTELNAEDGVSTVANNMGEPATPTAPAVANVSVVVKDPDVGIALAGAQDLAGLNVDSAQPGFQVFDLNSPAGSTLYHPVRIYAADLGAEELALNAMIANGIATGDGIFDSGSGPHPNAAVGVTDTASDDNGDPHILLRATIGGDSDCSGTVELNDFLKLQGNFGLAGTWDLGDYDYSGTTQLNDFLKLQGNFGLSYTPEPATLCLLALGGLAMLRRRRR